MNEKLLRLLFQIPDPITVNEFRRRTGKSESSIRKLISCGRLPIKNERTQRAHIMIMWNEWLEIVYDANQKIPSFEREGWKASWLEVNKLVDD
ncbi:hypothetical protein Xbed_03542 [Xenorhabdus beddingii]|uniref:Regulatory protein n=1 Tax=Xenorhabdus beddingii TaxID=40578 RepID=A0A1Y2SB17_9GAMM|nr:Cox family DNA-binding protein [Xenorhabdus beddingii]OTA15892.1 hypothetical protein Xbed_03542 [Xenorhabdus beddingii]